MHRAPAFAGGGTGTHDVRRRIIQAQLPRLQLRGGVDPSAVDAAARAGRLTARLECGDLD